MARGGVRVQILGEFNPKGFQEAEKAAKGLQGQFGELAKQAGALFATREVVNFAKSAVTAASDLGESINAVNVTFGEASAGILALGENAATAVGLSAREFNAFAVQFSGFTQQIAGSGGDVVAVTDELTTRIADFASVMNQDIPEAAQVFQSALAGETEPIRRFGIDMSAAAVQAYALREGLVASASEMTEAIKVQARYGLLMESTNKVAGDFANTSDSLANQQRVLAAQLDDLRATVGAALVPALEGLLNVGKPLLEAFTALPEGVQQSVVLFGVLAVAAKSVSTNLQAFGLSAKNANKIVGGLSIGLGLAVVAFNQYMSAQSEIVAASDRFKASLDAETLAIGENTEALIRQQALSGEVGDAIEMLGLDVEQFTAAIMGDTDARREFIESLDEAKERTTGLGDGLRSLFTSQMTNIDAARIVQREFQGVARGLDEARRETDRLADETDNLTDVTRDVTHGYSQFADVVLDTEQDVRVFLETARLAADAQAQQQEANQSAIQSFIAVGEALGHPIQQTRNLIQQMGLLDGMSVEIQIELGLFTEAEAALKMLDIQIRAIRESIFAAGGREVDAFGATRRLVELRSELMGLIREDASQPFTGGGGGGGGLDPVDEAQQDFERYVDEIVSFGRDLLTRDFGVRLFEGTPESIRDTFRDIMDDVAALTEDQLDKSLNGLIGNLQGRFAQLASLAQLRSTLQDQLEGIRETVSAAGDLFATGLQASAEESIREQLTRRVGEARAFVTNLRKLVGMGFPSAIIGDIVNAGLVDGAAMAAELASFSPREVQRFVSQFAQLGEFTKQAQALVSELLGGPEVEQALSGTNTQMAELVTAIQTDLAGAVNTFLSGLGAEVDRLIGVPSGGTVSGGATVWHPIHGQVPVDAPMTRMGDKSGAQVNVTVNAGIGTDGVQVGRQIVQVLNEYAAAGGPRISANLVA